MSGGVLILTVIGGVILGVLLTAALFFAFWWMRQPNSRQPLAAKSPGGDFPPPPQRRDEPHSETFATLPPHAESQQGFRTLEHHFESPQGMPWLDGIGGMVAGQRIKISRNETLLGRSRVCDVQFHDPKVSRQHALLRLYQGRYFIQDMQSSRGTLVNNRKVQSHMLQDGDEIRLGDSVVIFRMPDRPPVFETNP